MVKAIVGAAGLALCLTAALSAQAQVGCNDTIGPNETAFMVEDLFCAGEPAITVIGPATLHMLGHDLNCTEGNDGIHLEGTGARLVGPGLITQCETGVSLNDGGRHGVLKITVTNGTGDGIESNSPNNAIFFNVIDDVGEAGVDIEEAGGGTFVQRNYIANTGQDGIDHSSAAGGVRLFFNEIVTTGGGESGISASTDAKVIRNVIRNAGGSGISVNNLDVTVDGNRIFDSSLEGISVGVTAQNARVTRNEIVNSAENGITLNVNPFASLAAMNNLIFWNTVKGSGGVGILVEFEIGGGKEIGASSNTITRNTVLNSQFVDMEDQNLNPPCDDNSWRNNTFETEIDPGDCIN